jgi:hypothetical protein
MFFLIILSENCATGTSQFSLTYNFLLGKKKMMMAMYLQNPVLVIEKKAD